MNLKVNGFNLRVVNAYAPTDCDGTPDQKRKFTTTLQKHAQQTAKTKNC